MTTRISIAIYSCVIMSVGDAVTCARISFCPSYVTGNKATIGGMAVGSSSTGAAVSKGALGKLRV